MSRIYALQKHFTSNQTDKIIIDIQKTDADNKVYIKTFLSHVYITHTFLQ